MTNSSWCNDRLRKEGYDTDGTCPLCELPDSIHHRLWVCKCVQPQRLKVCPRWIIDEAVQDPSNPLWTHAVFPHPCAHPDYQGPVADGGCEFYDPEDNPMSPEQIDAVQWDDIIGVVDGSCQKHIIRDLPCAS